MNRGQLYWLNIITRVANEHFGVQPHLGILVTKQPDHMWLCACVTWALKVFESYSKAQQTQQVF